MPIYINKGTTLERPVKRVYLEGKEMKIVRANGTIQHMRTRLVFNPNRPGVPSPSVTEKTWGVETLGPLPILEDSGQTASEWYTAGGIKVSPSDITPMGDFLTRNYNLYARWSGEDLPEPIRIEEPTIASTAFCTTSGTVSDPTYTFSIAVTNTASIPVRMYVSIDGVWQNIWMNGNSTQTFTKSRSTPWSSVAVGVYATATGYEDSATIQTIKLVSCPVPDPDSDPSIKTAQPTIDDAYCYANLNTNATELHLRITNNDIGTVTIYSGNTSIGTIPGGSTKTLFFADYDLPGAWSASITAQASGKSKSDIETKSGNIAICVAI